MVIFKMQKEKVAEAGIVEDSKSCVLNEQSHPQVTTPSTYYNLFVVL
jgi:hypothetical protein